MENTENHCLSTKNVRKSYGVFEKDVSLWQKKGNSKSDDDYIMMKMKRDIYWDSLKFVLIILVVYGHTIESYAPAGSFNNTMFYFINIFHMPLFIFISGRFSQLKDRKHYQMGMIRVLETYLVFQIAKTFIPPILHHEDVGWSTIYAFFMIPGRALWYILSLLWWRFIVYIIPSKMLNQHSYYVLLICFIVSVCGGFIPVDRQLSFQRTLAFLPFFFMGYYSAKIDVRLWINKIPRILVIAMTLFLFMILLFVSKEGIPNVQLGRNTSYVNKDFPMELCCLVRCVLFLLAIVLSVMLMRIAPINKMTALWGRETLFVYIYHSFIITALQSIASFGYLPVNEVALFIYSIVITMGLIYIARIRRFNFLKFMLNPISNMINKRRGA